MEKFYSFDDDLKWPKIHRHKFKTEEVMDAGKECVLNLIKGILSNDEEWFGGKYQDVTDFFDFFLENYRGCFENFRYGLGSVDGLDVFFKVQFLNSRSATFEIDVRLDAGSDDGWKDPIFIFHPSIGVSWHGKTFRSYLKNSQQGDLCKCLDLDKNFILIKKCFQTRNGEACWVLMDGKKTMVQVIH